MIPAFSNVTNDSYHLLNDILQHPGSSPSDLFFDEPTVDGQLELLLAANLVQIDSSGLLSITELGRAAVKNYEYCLKAEKHTRTIDNIRYAINTLISFAAIIISIIALLK